LVQTRVKIWTRLTAEAVVGGVLGSLEQPEALILGCPDPPGGLRVAGRTTPLPRAARTEIATMLTPAVGGHPWPPVIPSSRFGHLASAPIEYLRVTPTTVVELDVDVSFENHRWRHGARFVRIRADLHVADVRADVDRRRVAHSGPNQVLNGRMRGHAIPSTSRRGCHTTGRGRWGCRALSPARRQPQGRRPLAGLRLLLHAQTPAANVLSDR
jgi:hypothetical protein